MLSHIEQHEEVNLILAIETNLSMLWQSILIVSNAFVFGKRIEQVSLQLLSLQSQEFQLAVIMVHNEMDQNHMP